MTNTRRMLGADIRGNRAAGYSHAVSAGKVFAATMKWVTSPQCWRPPRNTWVAHITMVSNPEMLTLEVTIGEPVDPRPHSWFVSVSVID